MESKIFLTINKHSKKILSVYSVINASYSVFYILNSKRNIYRPQNCPAEAAVVAGRITSESLINEAKDSNVKMILIHLEGGIDEKLDPVFGQPFGPFHLKTLIDSEEGERFMDFVRQNYRF